jgi:hypothetical protein
MRGCVRWASPGFLLGEDWALLLLPVAPCPTLIQLSAPHVHTPPYEIQGGDEPPNAEDAQ